jgi:hypothetical protein
MRSQKINYKERISSMKQKMLSLILLFAITTTIFSGCAQRIGDFTIVSTKNYEASKKFVKVGRFVGKDEVFFFIIPFGIPNIKNACDKAIEAGNGVYLTDAVLESTSSLFMIGYRITGDVWAPTSQSDLPKESGDLLSYQELMQKKPYIK